MKTRIALSLILGLCCAAMNCYAADKKGSDENNKTAPNTSSNTESGHSYVGLAIVEVPAALRSQLASTLEDGRGVLVSEVMVGSPAEKGGIRPGDILVSYDDQRLYTPGQFSMLVRHDKPGREATLDVIRNGKSQQVKVDLGSESSAENESSTGQGMERRTAMRPVWRSLTAQEQNEQWDTFDALTLTRVDKDHFKAEIKYRDDQGKVETKAFQGTRDEIRKDIDAQRDLPAPERDHLLQALDLPRHPWEIDLPEIRYVPE